MPECNVEVGHFRQKIRRPFLAHTVPPFATRISGETTGGESWNIKGSTISHMAADTRGISYREPYRKKKKKKGTLYEHLCTCGPE
jgi:hypothetical protein